MPSSSPTSRQALNRVIETLLSHGHVGVLAIDHQRLHVTFGDMLAPDDHRRTGKTIAGKHSRSASAHRGIDDGKIEGGIFDADVFG